MTPNSDLGTHHSELFPRNLCFLWKIIEAEIKKDCNRRGLKVSGAEARCDHAVYSFPPRKAKNFNRTPHGSLYRWCEGASTLVDDLSKHELETLVKYSVTSVSFQPRQDNFLALNKDCTEDDLDRKGEPGSGWCQIAFHHHRNNLSEVDFTASNYGLAAPSSESTWMPQVLPAVYDCFDYNEEASGGLCGKLGIIMGMGAFSIPAALSEKIVVQCFKMGHWIKHDGDTGLGRTERRVVIVKIYLDPRAAGVTKRHLKELEEGKYGPILATAPSNNYTTSNNVKPPTEMSGIPRYTSSISYAPDSAGHITASYKMTVPRQHLHLSGDTGNNQYPDESGEEIEDGYSQQR